MTRTLCARRAVLAAFIAATFVVLGGEARAMCRDVDAAIAKARGKVLVVNFWATWCGPCKREMPELAALRRDLSREEAAFLGVSVDYDPGAVERYLDEHEVNYAICFGGMEAIERYNATPIPKTIVYSPEGDIRHVIEGLTTREKLREIIKKVLRDSGRSE